MAVEAAERHSIDRKARMKLPYLDVPDRPVDQRIQDFAPTGLPLTPEQAMQAAERCIHCPDPAACMKACPVGNDIPAAMWLIEEGDFAGAAEVYLKTSSLPEICGRVCPHEALCQGSCVRSKHGEPVITGALEAFVMSYMRETVGLELSVGADTGKSVAIVGSGPSGLACAQQLIGKGHSVTIFEAFPAPGGLLSFGIPNFKLPNEVVQYRIQMLSEAGAKFVLNTRIGEKQTVDDLLNDGFDAVYLGVGTLVDAKFEAPGIDLPGLHQGTEFLIRANVDPSFLPEHLNGPLDLGDKLVVVGGGDTASDCLRTAIRLGVNEVTCLYRRTEAEMPGGKKDREMARAEGAKYRFLTQPIRFIAGPEGRVAAVECLQCELGEPDDSGRRRPVPIEGSNFTVEADTVVLALGYWPDALISDTTEDLETHKWGLIVADPDTGETSKPGVFAGGDAVTGPDLVVTAMRSGRRAAAAIDQYLKSQ